MYWREPDLIDGGTYCGRIEKLVVAASFVGSAALTGLTGLGRVARLHNRAPAARPSAGCATEAVITSHDLAIVDLWWVHIPEK